VDLGGGPGHEVIGFKVRTSELHSFPHLNYAQNWVNPGAVNRAHLVEDIGADRFLAILNVIIQAAFSFQGMELVCIAASETEKSVSRLSLSATVNVILSPRRNIAKAVRRVFYRIMVFYASGILNSLAQGLKPFLDARHSYDRIARSVRQPSAALQYAFLRRIFAFDGLTTLQGLARPLSRHSSLP
jgi:amino acid transporter